MQAKWKESLAKDHVGFQWSRLRQFGELADATVMEAVREVRQVWPHLSPAVVQSSFEA